MNGEFFRPLLTLFSAPPRHLFTEHQSILHCDKRKLAAAS
jgi:hypothetical protein